jgi:hypothetical protein
MWKSTSYGSDSDSDAAVEEKFKLSPWKFLDVQEYHGHIYVSIRQYYRDKKGEMKPMKKGISLRIDEWNRLVSGVQFINMKIDKLPTPPAESDG